MLRSAYELEGKPKLLVVDGAGTLFDPGSVVPAYAFQGSFKNALNDDGNPYCIDVDFSTIMKWMGRDKLEHVKLLLKEPEVLEQFLRKNNRNPTDEDAKRFYNSFTEQLYPSAAKTEEIVGVKEAAYKLKDAGIPMVMTTGYDRRMVDETRKKLGWLDDVLLASFTASDVKKGRPAPYLIYHAMEKAGVDNPPYVVNVGDTKVDTESADNAHMPGIIVTSGSITNREEAEKVNREIGKKHLILPSLVEIVDCTLDGTLADRIKELNNFTSSKTS